jgi:nucleotide-binding universal stress UspA family protein
MKKILVPVDFSDHANITCTYALEYAKFFPSELLLYHTYFDQIVIADSSFPDTIDMNTMYNEELMKEILHQSEKKLNELESKLQTKIKNDKIDGVTVRTEVTGGAVESELREICENYQPDLVVIGNKGEGKNISIWGRISTYLVNHIESPVLMIPEIRGFLGFTNIMVGVDLDEGNKSLIERVLTLFDTIPVNLHCVHFLVPRKHKKEEKERFLVLKEHFIRKESRGKISFEMIEIGEDNQKAIDTYIKEHNIQLIAFQPHKRSIFYTLFTANITKKNLFATNIPLLAMPVKSL